MRIRLMSSVVLGAAAALLAAGCATDSPTTTGSETGPFASAASSDKPDKGDVERLISKWPELSKKAAMEMMQKYGIPDEATPTRLRWNDNGPWKWTEVSGTVVDHHFPMPHPDLLEQAIDYKVPPEMFDELAMYDGSVIAERTKGQLSARCDKEPANFLALNLAHEIVTGKRNVEEARAEYARQIQAVMNNQPAPLTEKLMFSPQSGNSGDPDKPAM